MIPRPTIGGIYGDTYDDAPFPMTVQAISDTHVVATCPYCAPGEHPCSISEDRGHIYIRKEFFERYQGAGPFVERLQ